MGINLGVVGATGQVGVAMRQILEERGFPVDQIRFFASARSAGKGLPFAGRDVVVEDAETADPTGLDIALCSAGAPTSRALVPKFVDAGAVVVDNSSAFRKDPAIPLVVSEVNPEALDEHTGIVANPNCTTMVAMLPLKALHDAFDLRAMVATSFQAAGGAGQKGIDELIEQVRPVGSDVRRLIENGEAAAREVEAEIHANTLAFNVVPMLGTLGDNGYTDEEMKLQNESRKILALPELAMTPTCVRVPVAVGHSIAVRATFEREVALDEAYRALDAFPNLIVQEAPTPLE